MTTSRYVIMTYSNGSSSAKRIKKGFLERGLKCIILRNKNSKYKQRSKDILINWGKSKIHEKVNPKKYIFNRPEFVKNAIDKRIMAKKFWNFNRDTSSQGINYITHLNKSQALQLMDEGHSIVERHLGSSSKGKGVRVCHDKNELRDALFYTKYIKKRDEYRCHVAYDVEKNVYSVLDIRKKLRRRGQKPLSREIRSHDNGWVFVTLKDQPAEDHLINCIKENSISAVYLLGLDFGAVDLIHDKNSGEVYVLEVNTAPGLKSKVYEKYVSSFVSKITK